MGRDKPPHNGKLPNRDPHELTCAITTQLKLVLCPSLNSNASLSKGAPLYRPGQLAGNGQQSDECELQLNNLGRCKGEESRKKKTSTI